MRRATPVLTQPRWKTVASLTVVQKLWVIGPAQRYDVTIGAVGRLRSRTDYDATAPLARSVPII
jgi:hypothetical protein